MSSDLADHRFTRLDGLEQWESMLVIFARMPGGWLNQTPSLKTGKFSLYIYI